MNHGDEFSGWLRTFEEYHSTQTHEILRLMLVHLLAEQDMRFVYAEMSFFERFWSEINDADRENIRQ